MDFERASIVVKKLKTKPTNDELLILYGLYKQATSGNCNTPEPSFFQFEAKAKWNSWKAYHNVSFANAKQEYVNIVITLINKYGRLK